MTAPSAAELEQRAVEAWRAWGDFYRRRTRCEGDEHEGAELAECRAHYRRGPWLCLECFDLSPTGERAAAGIYNGRPR